MSESCKQESQLQSLYPLAAQGRTQCLILCLWQVKFVTWSSLPALSSLSSSFCASPPLLSRALRRSPRTSNTRTPKTGSPGGQGAQALPHGPRRS